MMAWDAFRRGICKLSCLGVLLGAVLLAGCPAPGPTDPPPGTGVRVEVTIVGQGDVNQDADGRVVTLTVVPADGWTFDGWSGADLADPTANPLVVNVDDVPSIGATFVNPSATDSDGDGVADDIDVCPDTPTTVLVDEVGCPVGDPGAEDTDGDGVGDDIDQCPDTAEIEFVFVDANGCAPSQLDSDGDGVTDDVDLCPGTPPRTQVDSNGCPVTVGPPVTCGNGVLETGEACDPPDGVTCDASCRLIGVPNDNCADALSVTDGDLPFSTVGATTDGREEVGLCSFFDYSHLESDVWFTYEATCDGPAIATLCGSDYDTKMAVYFGGSCPPGAPTACSDDDCGPATSTSRVEFTAIAGQTYLIRVGGYEGAQGEGVLAIMCDVDICAAAADSCSQEHEGKGCDDVACCRATCDIDPYCCDVTWDSFCATESPGLCSGSFDTCTASAGSCGAEGGNGTTGCDNVDCCNAVCMTDPFCCVDTWDDLCAQSAQGTCFLTCGGNSGGCFTEHSGPGCQDVTCCERVCENDSACCSVEWDSICTESAATLCR